MSNCSSCNSPLDFSNMYICQVCKEKAEKFQRQQITEEHAKASAINDIPQDYISPPGNPIRVIKVKTEMDVDEMLDKAEYNQSLKDFACALATGKLSTSAVIDIPSVLEAAELMCVEYEKRCKK